MASKPFRIPPIPANKSMKRKAYSGWFAGGSGSILRRRDSSTEVNDFGKHLPLIQRLMVSRLHSFFPTFLSNSATYFWS